MSQRKQQKPGSILNGIIIGLLLGVIVIAALLWFLNQNKPNYQTPPQASEPVASQPEILTPPGSQPSGPASAASMASAVDTAASDPMGDFVDQVDQPASAVQPPKTQPPVVRPKPTTAQPPKGKTTTQPTPSDVKPSPEQILDSGNVEKAREHAAAEQKAATAAKSGAGGSKVRIQAGSFATRDLADTQRAKLAMLGVDAQVTEGQVNGKTVYRVRTAAVTQAAAQDIQARLNSNGIDSMVMSAGK